MGHVKPLFPNPIKQSFFSLLLLQLTAVFVAFAQWTQTNGPYGCAANGFAVNGRNLFVASSSNRVLRSTDQGATWVDASSGLPEASYYNIYPIGNCLVVNNRTQLFKSTDEGASWNEVQTGLNVINDVVALDTVLFIGDTGGLYKSLDFGSNWSKISAFDSCTSLLRLHASSGIVFAEFMTGVFSKIFASTDQGTTWTWINASLYGYTVSSLLSVGPRIYAGVGLGVRYSDDLGIRWQCLGCGGLKPGADVLCNVGDTIYAGGARGVFRYNADSGIWVALTSMDESNKVRCMTSVASEKVDAPSKILFGINDKAMLFSSSNAGESWERADRGIVGSKVATLLADGDRLIAGGKSGVAISTDAGNSWRESVDGLSTTSVNSIVRAGESLIAGTAKGLYQSTDNGDTWSRFGPTDLTYVYDVAANDSFVVALFLNNVVTFGTNDHGFTWKLWSEAMLLGCFVDTYYLGMQVAVRSDSAIVVSDGAVYTTTDLGLTWSKSNFGDCTFFYAMGVGFQGADVVATAYGGGLQFRSSDFGKSWTKIEPGWPIEQINDMEQGLALTYGSGSNAPTTTGLFMQTRDGLQYSCDVGRTWSNISDGVLNNYDVSHATDNEHLYSAISYRGVWRRPLPQVVSVEDGNSEFGIRSTEFGVWNSEIGESPLSISVNPNPASDVVDVRYRLSLNTEGLESVVRLNSVCVSIFTSTGETVANISHEALISSGFSNVTGSTFTCNVSDLPTGLYSCRLSIGAFTANTTFAVVR